MTAINGIIKKLSRHRSLLKRTKLTKAFAEALATQSHDAEILRKQLTKLATKTNYSKSDVMATMKPFGSFAKRAAELMRSTKPHLHKVALKNDGNDGD